MLTFTADRALLLRITPLLGLALGACHFGESLKVLHASPTGLLSSTPGFVEIQFDRPILDPEAPGSEPRSLEIVTRPKLEGTVSFPTAASIAFSFNRTPPPATHVEVKVKAGLRSFDGEAVLKRDHRVSFTTATNAPEEISVLPQLNAGTERRDYPEVGERKRSNLGLHAPLMVRLRYSAPRAQLEKKVRVLGTPMAGGEARPVEFTLGFPGDAESVDRFSVEPVNTWPKHTHLDIEIAAGLTVALPNAGPVGTKNESALRVSTYGPIEIKNGPECELCTPPRVLAFEFSTPLNCQDVVDRLRLTPKVKSLKCAGQPRANVVRIEPVPKLQGFTEYTVTVDEGVTDIFGQELAASRTFALNTGSARPRFAHQLMFNVLERKLGASHEEKVYRTAQLKVRGKRLDFAEAWEIVREQGLDDQVAWEKLPWWLNDSYFFDYYGGDCYWDDELGDEVCGRTQRRYPGHVDTAVTLNESVETTLQVAKSQDWSVVHVPVDGFLQGTGGLVVLEHTPLDAEGRRLSNPVVRLLNITDIGLTARYSPNQMIIMAARLSDGKPISDAEIHVYLAPKGELDLGGKPIKAQTNEDGIAVIRASDLALNGEVPSLQGQPLFVSARLDDDEAFLWSKFASGGRRTRNEGPALVGAVYTERGVYRPGEKVFFRGVVRNQSAGGLTTPQGAVEVVATRGRAGYSDDETDDAIYKQTLSLSNYGTVYGEFEIPATARIGDYLFGAPAAGLDMRWSLRRSWGRFRSKRFQNAVFSNSDRPYGYDDTSGYTEFLDEGRGILDENGGFGFSRSLNGASARGRVENLILSATVDDKSGQSVSARRTVIVHPADIHVGLVRHGYIKDVGRMFTFDVVAVDTADAPAPGTRIRVGTRQTRWYSVKRRGPGGRQYWDWKREELKQDDVCTGKTDSRGVLKCQLTPKTGGSLQVVVSAQDNSGRPVKASSWYWVVGDADYYGGRSNGRNQVSVFTEKPAFDVGETARVAFSSPFQKALALVTVEREDILWQQVMEVGTNATVDLPIDSSWAPNVFVSATLVRGRVVPEDGLKPDPERDKPAYAMGYVNLRVKPTRNILEVDVSTGEKTYEPGQSITASISTKDHAGNGVASEINLYAVDEGVLMLTAYRTPDLVSRLFKKRTFGVLALDSRMHVLGRRDYITPVVKGEDDGGGGGESDASEQLREDFNPVATWVGALETDRDGKAKHTFKVPGTLTTYRLMAVAVTQDDRFGSGDSNFQVNKTLMMRQAMSRFVRPGDRLEAGVVVNQMTGQAADVEVTLDEIDENLFTVQGPRTLKQSVGANETVAFRFDISANDTDGVGEIVFAARMGEFRDQVKLTLPVERLQPRETVSVSGVLEPGTVSHSLHLPELARGVSFEFNASGLPVANLEEKVRGLVSYPYGCLEQRTSKVMPLAALQQLADELGFASIPSEKIEGWVNEWVALIPRYRCPDDGFDYYPGCRSGSDPYLTSFVLEGLVSVKALGFDVPSDVTEPAANYLENRLKTMRVDGSSWDRNVTGLTGALRVLAALGRKKPALEARLFEGHAGMPLFAKTDLVRAIHARTGAVNDQIETLLSEIDTKATRSDGQLRWNAEDPNRYWWAWDSSIRSTALVLRTLLQVKPADARIPLIVRGLIDLDNRSSYNATQGLTQTLLALADASRRLDTETKPVITASLAGVSLAQDRAVGRKVTRLRLSDQDLKGEGPFELKVKNVGPGPVYFGGFFDYAYPATARLPAQDSGFAITRRYSDRQGKPLGESVRVGDYVMVELEIRVSETGNMVVIDDPLPAGLEPLDTTLATSNKEMAAVMENAGAQNGSWWRSRYRELRDDRVAWHFRKLWETSRAPLRLRYLTRATTAGRFYSPGTRAERMYQPFVRGRAAGRELQVLPKQ